MNPRNPNPATRKTFRPIRRIMAIIFCDDSFLINKSVDIGYAKRSFLIAAVVLISANEAIESVKEPMKRTRIEPRRSEIASEIRKMDKKNSESNFETILFLL